MSGRLSLALAAGLVLSGCAIPRSGPLTHEIRGADAADGLEIVPLSPAVVAAARQPAEPGFPAEFVTAPFPDVDTLTLGDRLSIDIVEGAGGGQFPSVLNGMLKLEAVEIDQNGNLHVPYAGSVPAAGMSVDALRGAIVSRLERKIYRPQVALTLQEQPRRSVTIYGAVANGGAHSVTPRLRRLSDLLGAAGVENPQADQVLVDVRRGGTSARLPLSRIFQDAQQDIALQPGDVVTVSTLSEFVTVMGAAGMQGRIPIVGRSFSLLDALASARGLNDEMADPSGVFVFRRLPDAAPGQPAGRIYQLDVTDPAQILLAGQFQVAGGDTVYVSTASFVQTRKVLTAIGTSLGFVARTTQIVTE